MRRLLCLLLVPVLVAACADDGEDVVTQPDGDGATGDGGGSDGSGGPGGGEDGLVVSIEMIHGQADPEQAFATLPVNVVYDDGRTASPGAVIAIYPGPALLPLTLGQVDDGALDRIVAAAEEAGLLGGDRPLGEERADDAGLLRITVVVGGVAHVTELPLADDGAVADDAAVDDTAVDRGRVEAFVDEVSTIVAEGETAEQFPIERYRVRALEPRDDPDVEPNRLDWPLDEDPSATCTPVTGDDATTLAAALDQATQITIWTGVDGDEFRLALRPVLPHEPDC